VFDTMDLGIDIFVEVCGLDRIGGEGIENGKRDGGEEAFHGNECFGITKVRQGFEWP